MIQYISTYRLNYSTAAWKQQTAKGTFRARYYLSLVNPVTTPTYAHPLTLWANPKK